MEREPDGMRWKEREENNANLKMILKYRKAQEPNNHWIGMKSKKIKRKPNGKLF